MAKYLVLLFVTVVALAQLSESRPYQVLKSRDGFIPVFIRYGDQPLSEIDPLLAEAFGEHEITARNIKTDEQQQHHSNIVPVAIEKLSNAEGIIKDALNSAGFETR